MSNEDIQLLQEVVDQQIQENLGMSMIYTIVSAAQEWMQDRVSHQLLQLVLGVIIPCYCPSDGVSQICLCMRYFQLTMQHRQAPTIGGPASILVHRHTHMHKALRVPVTSGCQFPCPVAQRSYQLCTHVHVGMTQISSNGTQSALPSARD